MTVKAILDVDVDADGNFAKFFEQFKEYQESLKKTKSSWEQQTAAIGGSREAFNELVGLQKTRLLQTRMIGEAEKAARSELDRPMKERADNEKRIAEQMKRQAKAWEGMAGGAKKFASSIGDATKSLMQWASLTGVISGLVGAGGLFGIDRLATGVGTARRKGLGLGVNPGDQQAFNLNMGRVVGSPDALLGGVNQALHDPTKSVPFFGLGLNYQTEQQKGTFGASMDVMRALKGLADKTPDKFVGNVFNSRHLGDLGITQEDFLAIKNMPKGAIDAYLKDTQKDAKALNLPPNVQKQWQDLQVQLGRAGTEIERTFVIGLAPLAPQIEQLSADFTKLIGDLLASPEVQGVITEIDNGLKEFDDYLKSGKLKSDFDYVSDQATIFGDKIKDAWGQIQALIGKDDKDSTAPGDTLGQKKQLAEGSLAGAGAGGLLGWILGGKWGGRLGAVLGGGAGYVTEWGAQWADHFDARHGWAGNLDRYVFPDKPASGENSLSQDLSKSFDSFTDELKQLFSWSSGASHTSYETEQDNTRRFHSLTRSIVYRQPYLGSNGAPLPGATAIPSAPSASLPAANPAWASLPFDDLAGKLGVPTNFAKGIFRIEGGLNSDGTARISKAGAIGAGQLMPGTARDLGVDPYDAKQNVYGSLRYMSMLLKRFSGDQDEAAAAYNWGAGHVSKDMAAHGDKWLSFAPDETKRYVEMMQKLRALGKEDSAVAANFDHHDRDYSGARRGSGMDDHQQYAHVFRDRSAKVVIQNQTGGNAHVTVATLAV